MTRISNETSKIFKDPSYISKKLSDLKKKKTERISFQHADFCTTPLRVNPRTLKQWGQFWAARQPAQRCRTGSNYLTTGRDKYCIGGESVSRRATADAFEYKLGNIRTDSISLDRRYDLSNEKEEKSGGHRDKTE